MAGWLFVCMWAWLHVHRWGQYRLLQISYFDPLGARSLAWFDDTSGAFYLDLGNSPANLLGKIAISVVCDSLLLRWFNYVYFFCEAMVSIFVQVFACTFRGWISRCYPLSTKSMVPQQRQIQRRILDWPLLLFPRVLACFCDAYARPPLPCSNKKQKKAIHSPDLLLDRVSRAQYPCKISLIIFVGWSYGDHSQSPHDSAINDFKA